MTERPWKLGVDMLPYDHIFDPITFDDIITALHCNERVIDRDAVHKVMGEIICCRIQDFHYIVCNNIDEIIAEAAKGRE